MNPILHGDLTGWNNWLWALSLVLSSLWLFSICTNWHLMKGLLVWLRQHVANVFFWASLLVLSRYRPRSNSDTSVRIPWNALVKMVAMPPVILFSLLFFIPAFSYWNEWWKVHLLSCNLLCQLYTRSSQPMVAGEIIDRARSTHFNMFTNLAGYESFSQTICSYCV